MASIEVHNRTGWCLLEGLENDQFGIEVSVGGKRHEYCIRVDEGTVRVAKIGIGELVPKKQPRGRPKGSKNQKK